MKGTLYGSLTSPYARLTRLVRTRSGADSSIAFEPASPWDDSFRAVNPLGKVPAMVMEDGAVLAETSLIVRSLMEIGGQSLLPAEPAARRQAEADVALCLGLLDLGVAYFLESRRDASEQSGDWQKRRQEGLRLGMTSLEEAAGRAEQARDGAAALALACTADWLDFRLGDKVDWQNACPTAAAVVADMLTVEDIAATDPRLA